MALSLAQKEQIVQEVASVAEIAHSLVGAEYRGLSVAEMSKLRSKARAVNVQVRVVKNSLARRAFANTPYEGAALLLTGPMVLAFGLEDPGSAGRVAETFAQEHDLFKVKVVAIAGRVLSPEDLPVLARMPTYDEALSHLAALLKAPLGKMASTLNEIPAKLVRTVSAVKDSM